MGKGVIVLDSGAVSFEGKRQRLFRFAVDRVLTFEVSSVVGVYRSGKMLCVEFAVKGMRQLVSAPVSTARAPFIKFWAADDAMAREIASLLPRCQPGVIARELVDEAEFQARLRATTPKAYVTPVLVVVNVLVFLGMIALGAGFLLPKAEVLVLYGSNFGPLTTHGQWWRLFTSMFLHGGVIHLALNMWALYETGRLVERLYGNLHFLVLYLLAGLAGSLASLLWNPTVNSVGASGAILGVFGAMLAFMMKKGNHVPFGVIKKQRNSTLGFIANTLAYGFTHAGIDNAAHLGGLAAGFLLGLLLARPLDPTVRVQGGASRLSASSAAGALALLLLSLAVRVDPKNADALAAKLSGRDPTALRLVRPMAGLGDASAQNALGAMYASGKGVPLDYVEAAKWYRKAADQGNPAAQYNLGVAYANGLGVPLDDAEALKWYRKAAEQGDADAQRVVREWSNAWWGRPR